MRAFMLIMLVAACATTARRPVVPPEVPPKPFVLPPRPWPQQLEAAPNGVTLPDPTVYYNDGKTGTVGVWVQLYVGHQLEPTQRQVALAYWLAMERCGSDAGVARYGIENDLRSYYWLFLCQG